LQILRLPTFQKTFKTLRKCSFFNWTAVACCGPTYSTAQFLPPPDSEQVWSPGFSPAVHRLFPQVLFVRLRVPLRLSDSASVPPGRCGVSATPFCVRGTHPQVLSGGELDS
jgi:hypothetical protein